MKWIDAIPKFVDFSVSSHLELWYSTPSDEINPSSFPLVHTKSQSNAIETQQVIDELIQRLKNNHSNHPEDEKNMKALFTQVFKCDPDVILSKEYKVATLAFFQKAKSYDPNINYSDIYQAIRNLWIANSIQHLMGIPIKLTPSIFAYSMLYPYSDNLLDDEQISLSDKRAFNARFRLRLQGEILIPKNQIEEKIFNMVQLIEEEYSRSQFPSVFEALLAIHTGQEKSVQMNQFTNNLSVTFEKGGTSVLADGMLITGNLSVEQADFFMGYGIFLQLLDDLQDIDEDIIQNQASLFTDMIHISSLDNTVIQLVNFMLSILQNGQNVFPHKENFFHVIQNCTLALLSRSIYKHKQYFTTQFVRDFEEKTGFKNDTYLHHKSSFQQIDQKDMETYLYALLNKKSYCENLNF